MFRSLTAELRSVLIEDGETSTAAAPKKKSKHDRASEKVGFALSTPPENISRKKLLKMIPHMDHHFEKGHGAGEGDYKTVDAADLTTLGRHAQKFAAHADSVGRMPGPAHAFASKLCSHTANAHERMSKFFRDNSDDESADLHANEHGKFKHLAHDHAKKARRHGFGY